MSVTSVHWSGIHVGQLPRSMRGLHLFSLVSTHRLLGARGAHQAWGRGVGGVGGRCGARRVPVWWMGLLVVVSGVDAVGTWLAVCRPQAGAVGMLFCMPCAHAMSVAVKLCGILYVPQRL